MSKLKVGERYIVGILDEKGNTIEITEVSTKSGLTSYKYKTILGNSYGFSSFDGGTPFADSLKPACDRYELHITSSDGKTTNAVYKIGGKIIERKSAICSPNDTFDFALGAKAAFDRVFPPKVKETPKPKFKIGDKVEIVNAADGCLGANGLIGVVTTDRSTDGFLATSKGINVRVSPESVWRVNVDALEHYAEPVKAEPKFKVGNRYVFDKDAWDFGGTVIEITSCDIAWNHFKVISGKAPNACHDVPTDFFSDDSEFAKHLNPYIECDTIKLFCIKDDSIWLTKGKIYEIHPNTGEFSCDWNNGLPLIRKIRSIEELFYAFQSWRHCLVPLVSRPAKVGEWMYITDGAIGTAKDFCNKIVKITSIGDNGLARFCAHEVTKYHAPVLLQDYLVLDGYKPEPEYYNGKIVCIDTGHYVKETLTAGKVYSVKNGRFNCDTGSEMPILECDPFCTLEELNRRLSVRAHAKFIEYKGEA